MCNGGRAAFLKLQRDIGGGGYADSAYIGDAGNLQIPCSFWTGAQDWNNICGNIGYLDTTNTTSEVTYKLQGLATHATYKLGINMAYDDPDTIEYGRAASSITVYEVGA